MAVPEYLIGVDLGTSSTKSALYRTDGQLVCESTEEVPIYYPSPGQVEQEQEDFYFTAAATVKRCVQESGIEPRQIVGIAFDSQMAGIGAIDEAFKPAIRFDSWLDMRCQPYIEAMDVHADLVTRLTGCPPTVDHGPKMLWWKHERPREYQRIARFVTPAGYVAGRMAGLRGDQGFMDYTFLHFTGFSDAQRGTWSDTLCDLFDFDVEKLPEIVDPWHVVGEVNSDAARDFGLAPGTIIAAGCGDTAAGALGGGIVRPGMIFDVAGTAAVFAGCTSEFIADRKHKALLTMRSVIPGLWHPLAYIAGGGIAVRWFRDQFFRKLPAETHEFSPDLYAEMMATAADIPPGSDGLFFSPHLGGRICPAAPEMRGAWVGFSWGHTQAHFVRAILESVAYEYAYYLSILRELIPDLLLSEARVIGGGARSSFWNQIKADVLGVPYQPLAGSEFSSWGSAMIAGKAAGLFDDLSEVAYQSARGAGSPNAPSSTNTAIYEPIVDAYIQWQQIFAEQFGRQAVTTKGGDHD